MVDSDVRPASDFIEQQGDGSFAFVLPPNVRIAGGRPNVFPSTQSFEASNEPGTLRPMSVEEALVAGQRAAGVVKDLLGI